MFVSTPCAAYGIHCGLYGEKLIIAVYVKPCLEANAHNNTVPLHTPLYIHTLYIHTVYIASMREPLSILNLFIIARYTTLQHYVISSFEELQ